MMQTARPQVMFDGRGEGGEAVEVRRGTKRDASDSKLSDFERFEKRLRMLSLRNEGTKTPNPNKDPPLFNPSSTAPPTEPLHHNPKDALPADELMQVDDTHDRLYIHDLDAELADDESEEERLIFLPDIEKKLSKIPQQVLTGRDDNDLENQELVLYTEPKSLTTDEGHDSVKRLIIEARQRAREAATEAARQEDMNRKYAHMRQVEPAETAHGYGSGYLEEQAAEIDAMDIG